MFGPIESLHLGQIEVRIFIHIQFGKLIQKKLNLICIRVISPLPLYKKEFRMKQKTTC